MTIENSLANMMDEPSEQPLVQKSVRFATAQYKLSMMANELCYCLCSVIAEEGDKPEYMVFVKSAIDITGGTNKHKYRQYREASDDLLKEFVVSMIDKDGIWRTGKANFLQTLFYIPEKGAFLIKPAEWLKEEVLTSNRRIKYLFRNILSLKSVYSRKLYELSQSYRTKGFYQSDLKTLRGQLGLADDQYPAYFNFKQQVLCRAIDEINRNEVLDITLDLVELKESRAVSAIKLIISGRVKVDTSPLPMIDAVEEAVLLRLLHLKVSRSMAMKVLQEFDKDYVAKKVDLFEKRLAIEKKKPEDQRKKMEPGYLIDGIRNGWTFGVNNIQEDLFIEQEKRPQVDDDSMRRTALMDQFKQERSDEVDRIFSSLSQTQLQEVLEELMDSNYTISELCKRHGKDSTIVQRSIKGKLYDRLPPILKSFREYAAQFNVKAEDDIL